MSKTKITYSSAGVDYSVLDPLKKLAQQAGKQTAKNLSNFGAREISQSRGESAYVWEEEDAYRALVIEGLGTKNLLADEMAKITGKSYYDVIAQDSVAAIVNDLITVGAMPQVISAYFATGNPEWFKDQTRMQSLVEGWAKATDMAGASWGGGETPGLSGIINPNTIDLAGSSIGIIKPKKRLVSADKLQAGDNILLIGSSGIHANGLSLARAVAKNLPDGYQTKLANGLSYGEALLIPTYIYVTLIRELLDSGIDIHYMVNITGHGLRKLMRADRDFSYIINHIPPALEIFEFIQKHSGNSDRQMFGTFNMGAGFAIFLPPDQVQKAIGIVEKNNFKAQNAGFIEQGERQVVIKPKNIIFKKADLDLR